MRTEDSHPGSEADEESTADDEEEDLQEEEYEDFETEPPKKRGKQPAHGPAVRSKSLKIRATRGRQSKRHIYFQ